MDKKEINAKFKELAELKMMLVELSAAITEIESAIKTYMSDNELTELTGDEHKAMYTSFEKSNFDTKRFKADNPKIAAMYTTTKTQYRFTFA